MKADETYRIFARHYDTYTASFEEDLAFYSSFCSPQDRILEVGCGTGRILQHFLRNDFQLTGIDISQEMLDIAREKLKDFATNGTLRLALHDFSREALPEVYDKIFVTWYTFNYILAKPEIFLQNLFQSAADLALVVFDLFYPKTLAAPERDDMWRHYEFQDAQGSRIQVKDKRRMFGGFEERIQIYEEEGQAREILTKRRYYRPEQIKEMLENCGFSRITFSESYTAEDFREEIFPGPNNSHFVVKAYRES